MASNQLWREASCARRAVVNEHADLYHFRPERGCRRRQPSLFLSLFLTLYKHECCRPLPLAFPSRLAYHLQTTTPLFRIPAPERDAPPSLGRKLPLSPQYQHRPRAVCCEDSGLLDHLGIAPWPRRSNTILSATLLAAVSFAYNTAQPRP
jgi:hypothetical protein